MQNPAKIDLYNLFGLFELLICVLDVGIRGLRNASRIFTDLNLITLIS